MGIIGGILGDISGSIYEYTSPSRYNYKELDLFDEKRFFTDDTVLILATKYAVQGKISYESVYRMFGKLYPNSGWGSMFNTWLMNPRMGAYNSCGNGSAVRAIYIGEYFKTEDEVIKQAIQSAKCTHNHEEGISGAIATAMCVFMAENGASKEEIHDYIVRDFDYDIDTPVEELRKTMRYDETCQICVPIAIRSFLESENYDSCLRNVYSIDCDTDSVCAIAGGIAESFYKNTEYDSDGILRDKLDVFLYGALTKKFI